MIKIKVGYSCTRLIFKPSPSAFRFEYEYFLRLKVSSTGRLPVLRKAVLEYTQPISVTLLYFLD